MPVPRETSLILISCISNVLAHGLPVMTYNVCEIANLCTGVARLAVNTNLIVGIYGYCLACPGSHGLEEAIIRRLRHVEECSRLIASVSVLW